MATRIVVLTDVHGNLPALAAILEQTKRLGYDALFHTGDAIGIGPFPGECLETLLSLANSACLMGNHDAWFANGLPHPQPEWMSDGEVCHHRWTHAAITPSLRSAVAAWPYALQRDFEGVKTTLVHYGLAPSRQAFVPIIREPTATDLDHLFQEFRSDLIFYGHHHPFADVQGQARYINPGSAGCDRQATARFCIVDFAHQTYAVEYRTVAYDDTAPFSAFERRQVPEREWLYGVFFGGRFPSSG